MADNPFELGAKVTFTKFLARHKDNYGIDRMHRDSKPLILPHIKGYYTYPAYWVENSFSNDPTHGVVIGKKTLSDGYTIYDREEGNQYYPLRHFTAWEVVYSLYRKSVLVLSPRPWFTFELMPPEESQT